MSQFKLPPTTHSYLGDKLYERRKLGALEIEQLIKEFTKNNEIQKIKDVITQMQSDFIVSGSLNARKGGLIAMAAITLGLGEIVTDFFPLLLPPVISCFQDADPKVRFYACESLYNIIKVTREKILPYFNEVFDKLCHLAADPDKAVRDAADLLDKMLKEIIKKYPIFDYEKFIPLFSDRVNHLIAPGCRKVILSWVKVFHSVSEIDDLRMLHFFLEGILKCFLIKMMKLDFQLNNVWQYFLKKFKNWLKANLLGEVQEVQKIF